MPAPLTLAGDEPTVIILTAGEAGTEDSLEGLFFLEEGKERPLFLGKTVTHFSVRGGVAEEATWED